MNNYLCRQFSKELQVVQQCWKEKKKGSIAIRTICRVGYIETLFIPNQSYWFLPRNQTSANVSENKGEEEHCC